MKVLQWGPENHTHIREDSFGGGEDAIEIAGDTAVVRYGRQPLPVVVRSAGEMSQKSDSDGGRYLEVRFAHGSGDIVIAFAREVSQAAGLAASVDVEVARQAVDAYYASLLAARIETPESEIDGAFRSAIFNLEYN